MTHKENAAYALDGVGGDGDVNLADIKRVAQQRMFDFVSRKMAENLSRKNEQNISIDDIRGFYNIVEALYEVAPALSEYMGEKTEKIPVTGILVPKFSEFLKCNYPREICNYLKAHIKAGHINPDAFMRTEVLVNLPNNPYMDEFHRYLDLYAQEVKAQSLITNEFLAYRQVMFCLHQSSTLLSGRAKYDIYRKPDEFIRSLRIATNCGDMLECMKHFRNFDVSPYVNGLFYSFPSTIDVARVGKTLCVPDLKNEVWEQSIVKTILQANLAGFSGEREWSIGEDTTIEWFLEELDEAIGERATNMYLIEHREIHSDNVIGRDGEISPTSYLVRRKISEDLMNRGIDFNVTYMSYMQNIKKEYDGNRNDNLADSPACRM